MDKILKYIPDIIEKAAKNPFGLLALMIIILSVLGFFFFRKSSDHIRAGMFVLMFIGVASFAAVTLRATTDTVQPAGHLPNEVMTPTIVTATTVPPHLQEQSTKADENPSTLPLKGQGLESGLSTVPVLKESFTGAIVTLSDGSIVKLRDNIHTTLCGGAELRTVQGQSISMDKMSRFDILDWDSGNTKITLTNAEVITVKLRGCGELNGRNDLGDFSTEFDKIRSVDFVR